VSRRTEAELVEALAEDEAQQGRPHTPGERESFARGFFSTEYREEVRRLMSLGAADEDES
jgi:hypothetical protein